MQKAKAFLFVSVGIFLLALAYHLGATSATAQASKSQVVAAYYSNSFQSPLPGGSTVQGNVVVMSNGDLYLSSPAYGIISWVKAGNVFTP